jgi:hypothetical protein
VNAGALVNFVFDLPPPPKANFGHRHDEKMGRRKGSTNNSKHHKAGGKRSGSGRPRIVRDNPANQQLQQPTLQALRARNAIPVQQDDELAFQQEAERAAAEQAAAEQQNQTKKADHRCKEAEAQLREE